MSIELGVAIVRTYEEVWAKLTVLSTVYMLGDSVKVSEVGAAAAEKARLLIEGAQYKPP